MNYFEAAYMATQHLRDECCRRIGFAIEPQLEKRTGHRWLGGYMAALGKQQAIVYEGIWPMVPESFTDWCNRERLDGLLALGGRLHALWPGNPGHFILLNTQNRQAHRHIKRFYLDPRHIGAEGLRCMHHLLLRQEYGLPEAPKVTGLQGYWIEDRDS